MLLPRTYGLCGQHHWRPGAQVIRAPHSSITNASTQEQQQQQGPPQQPEQQQQQPTRPRTATVAPPVRRRGSLPVAARRRATTTAATVTTQPPSPAAAVAPAEHVPVTSNSSSRASSSSDITSSASTDGAVESSAGSFTSAAAAAVAVQTDASAAAAVAQSTGSQPAHIADSATNSSSSSTAETPKPVLPVSAVPAGRRVAAAAAPVRPRPRPRGSSLRHAAAAVAQSPMSAVRQLQMQQQQVHIGPHTSEHQQQQQQQQMNPIDGQPFLQQPLLTNAAASAAAAEARAAKRAARAAGAVTAAAAAATQDLGTAPGDTAPVTAAGAVTHGRAATEQFGGSSSSSSRTAGATTTAAAAAEANDRFVGSGNGNRSSSSNSNAGSTSSDRVESKLLVAQQVMLQALNSNHTSIAADHPAATAEVTGSVAGANNGMENSSSSSSSNGLALRKLLAQQVMSQAMSNSYSSTLWDTSNLREWEELQAELATDQDQEATAAAAAVHTAAAAAAPVASTSDVSTVTTQPVSSSTALEHGPLVQSEIVTNVITNNAGVTSGSQVADDHAATAAVQQRHSTSCEVSTGAAIDTSAAAAVADGSIGQHTKSGAAQNGRSSSSNDSSYSSSCIASSTSVNQQLPTSSTNDASSGETASNPALQPSLVDARDTSSNGGSSSVGSSSNTQGRSTGTAVINAGVTSEDLNLTTTASNSSNDITLAARGPTASSSTNSSSSSTVRRRVKPSSSSSSSSSDTANSLAAVQQLVAGQRQLAAAQRRAGSSGSTAATAAAAGAKKKRRASTSSSGGDDAGSSSSNAAKPGDVQQFLGKWVLTGFDEDQKAVSTLVPALQQRLRSAVEAEQQHEESAIKALYNKGSLKRLQKDGLVLLQLQALPHSVLYSSMVWKFSAKQAGKELPYHRFRQGDNLLITRFDDADSSSGSKGGSSSSSSSSNGGVWPGRDAKGMRPLDATVLEVRKDHLLLTVDKSDSDLMQRALTQAPAAAMVSWRLDQSVRDTTARRQIEAINRLKHLRVPGSAFEQLLRYCLVGTPSGHYIASLPPVWVRDPAWRADLRALLKRLENLNASQKKAIAQAAVRSLTLWQGPPGTGKTRTLLALVEVLVKTALMEETRWKTMGPLLACADTNAAVDNLVEGLINKGLKVVRLGQPAKVRAGLRHVTLEALAEATPLGQRAAALRETSKALFERAKLAAEGSLLGWANSSSSKASPDAVTRSARSNRSNSTSVATAPAAVRGVGLLDSDALEQDAKRNWAKAEQMTREAAQLVLSEAHVVCATCAGAGDPVLSDLHFNVVVIDEATQATEPATLVPLTQGAQCAIMAGDPAQLPPTIVSREAYKYDLDKTLFDRLQQGVGLAPLLLDTQYRMNPAISRFPSQWFYGGRLKDGVTASAKPPAAGISWPVANAPVMMVAIQGLEEKAEKSGQKFSKNGSPAVNMAASTEAGLEDASFRNLPEARVALQALHALMTAGDAATGAILTPYKGQVRSLEYGLRVLAPYFAGMEISVSSVDGYQGREADVIVFTAVRCNKAGNIGFVSDPRRLNVAITRPRRGLVVVCSPQTLSKGSDNWHAFVQCCDEQGWIAGPEQLPAAPWQTESVDPFAARPASADVSSNNGVVSSSRRAQLAAVDSLGSV